MIVAMNVEDDEALVPSGNIVEQPAKHAIIGSVNRQRFGDQFRSRGAFPDLQAPTLFGRLVDSLVGATIEIELEARAMRDDVRRDI